MFSQVGLNFVASCSNTETIKCTQQVNHQRMPFNGLRPRNNIETVRSGNGSDLRFPSAVFGAQQFRLRIAEMVKFEFDPGSSALPVDGKLLIQNSDPFVHDFTLDDLDIAVSIGPGSEALVDLTGLTAGTYDYICSLHSDGETGMVGTIVISG